MGLLTAKGSEAVTSAAKETLDLSKVMIRLKDGESVKVRLLGVQDFAEYQAISSFNLGVYTQPSREPLGEKDYFVEAWKLAKEGKVDEKFADLFPRKRYLVAMADVETKEVRVWDCSKSQFNAFVSSLSEYEEAITDADEEAVFTFKRTGNKKDTAYSLSYVPKPKKAELEGFHSFDGQEVTEDFLASVLQVRSPELQVSVLKEAGFPVEEYFPEINLEEGNAEGKDTASPLDSI